MPSRARNGRRRVGVVGMHRARVRPGDVGQVAEDAVEVDGRSARRAGATARAAAGRRRRWTPAAASRSTSTTHDVDVDDAARVRHGDGGRARRAASTGRGRAGSALPRETGTTCRAPFRPPTSWRGRRPTPTAARSCIHGTEPARERSRSASSVDSGDAAARSDRDLRRPHPDHLRHPERLRRRGRPRRPDRRGDPSAPAPGASIATATRSSPARSSAAPQRVVDRRSHRHGADQRKRPDARRRDRR